MKLSELLKSLFGDKLDEDVTIDDTPVTEPTEPIEEPAEPIEEPNEPVEEPVEEPVTEPVVEPTEPVVEPTEPVVEPTEPIEEPAEPVYVDIFEDGWLCSESGNISIDFKKIKNEEVQKMIAFIQSMYDFKVELTEYVKGLSLTVSNEFLISLLEFGDIDKSKGSNKDVIEKAINELKVKEPGLFGSDPLGEGFDPVNKGKSTVVNSFVEAFELMQ